MNHLSSPTNSILSSAPSILTSENGLLDPLPTLEEFRNAVKGRGIRVRGTYRSTVKIGSRFFQNSEPLVSINTDFTYANWDGGAGTWYGVQYDAAQNNTGVIRAALLNTTAATFTAFRELSYDARRDNRRNISLARPPGCEQDVSRVAQNCFDTEADNNQRPGERSVWLHVYSDISRINNSCRPNATVIIDEQTGQAEIMVTKDLDPTVEIEIDYAASLWLSTYSERSRFLSGWNFNCKCPDCRTEGARKQSNANRREMRNWWNGLGLKSGSEIPPMNLDTYRDTAQGRAQRILDANNLLNRIEDQRGQDDHFICASMALIHALVNSGKRMEAYERGNITRAIASKLFGSGSPQVINVVSVMDQHRLAQDS